MTDGDVPADARPFGLETVARARARMSDELAAIGVAEAALEAKLLVAHAVAVPPSRLSFERERRLTPTEARVLAAMLRDRRQGRSVGRIVGQRAFHDIVLAVRDNVLEPRDDTGALVDLALLHLRAVCDRGGSARLLDVGTGSGAVALALLAAEPRAVAVGTDINPDAVSAARRNADRLGLADRFAARRLPLLGDPADGPFDLVASNPPYIRSGDIAGLAAEVRHDPATALDGGPDGLDFYRALAARSADVLAPEGWLAVEIGAGQGPDVRGIMASHGWIAAGARDDLGGHSRALAFERGRPVRRVAERGGGQGARSPL